MFWVLRSFRCSFAVFLPLFSFPTFTLPLSALLNCLSSGHLMLALIIPIKISLAFQNQVNLAHTQKSSVNITCKYKWYFDWMRVTDSFCINYWPCYIDVMLIDNIYFPFPLIPEISSLDVSRIGLIRINCMEKHIGYVCKREVDILG